MIFLKAISNCHYHKFMFELSKKQSKVRFIIIDVLSRSPKTDHGTKWSISLLQIYLGSTLVSSSGVCLKTCIFCSTVFRSQGFDQGGLWPERPDDGLLHKHCLDSDLFQVIYEDPAVLLISPHQVSKFFTLRFVASSPLQFRSDCSEEPPQTFPWLMTTLSSNGWQIT